MPDHSFLNKALSSLLLFLLLSLTTFSQTYSFDNYTVQDGIIQSNVAAVLQDNNGYIWLGTGSGLSKFNGKTFQNYSTDDSLADNNITAMFLDRKKNIWLGHANGGLTKYNFSSGKFEIIRTKALPADHNIFALYQDKKGRLWVCFENYGAVVINDPYGDLSDKKKLYALC